MGLPSGLWPPPLSHIAQSKLIFIVFQCICAP